MPASAETVRSPYSRLKWFYLISHLTNSGMFEEALDTIYKSKEYGFSIENRLIHLYFRSGNQEKLEEIYNNKVLKQEKVSIFLLAAMGKKEDGLQALSQLSADRINIVWNIGSYYLLGQQVKKSSVLLSR
jgi:hypothetical protein